MVANKAKRPASDRRQRSAEEAPESLPQGRDRYLQFVAERAASNWERYVQELRKVGRLVVIDGVYIDGESTFRRRFVCDTRTCSPGRRPMSDPNQPGEKWRGHKRDMSCCADLVVDLAAIEVESLRRHWEPVRDWLASKRSFFKGKRLEDCLELSSDFEVSLRKRKGRCIFALKDPEWGIRCGLHSACLDLGLPVNDVKPVTCDTFPLIVIDLSPGRWYLGAHDDDVDAIASLGKHGTKPFPCLVNPKIGERMYVAMKDTIKLYFGDAFYEKLAAAAKVYLMGPKPRPIVPPHERDDDV